MHAYDWLSPSYVLYNNVWQQTTALCGGTGDSNDTHIMVINGPN